MTQRVVVWGTGNVGRPAIRRWRRTGTSSWSAAALLLSRGDVDAVVYTATADTRPAEALADLVACLEAGADVVSTSFYPLLHPRSAPRELLDVVEPACAKGDASVFVSGIDPGWALDILPALASIPTPTPPRSERPGSERSTGKQPRRRAASTGAVGVAQPRASGGGALGGQLRMAPVRPAGASHARTRGVRATIDAPATSRSMSACSCVITVRGSNVLMFFVSP